MHRASSSRVELRIAGALACAGVALAFCVTGAPRVAASSDLGSQARYATTSLAAAQRPPSQRAVLDAIDRYVREYQKSLTFVIADEDTTQEVSDGTGLVTQRRVTRGELFVTFVPADHAWLAVHDVSSVDGAPVDGHEDIRELLERQSIGGVARQLVARNARYNIGKVLRNFNEPTLALLVLDPRRRRQFRFDLRAAQADADPDLVTLAFRETDWPTLVRAQTHDVYSTGDLQVDAATGVVRRTSIRFVDGATTADLQTVYAHEPRLDMWLPSTFTERYEQRSSRRNQADAIDVVQCVSTYTNWRRFAATSSFVPAP